RASWARRSSRGPTGRPSPRPGAWGAARPGRRPKGVVGAAVAWTDDLAALVADRTAGVSAYGAERRQLAVAAADDDVGPAVLRVLVGGRLAGRQVRRGSQPHGALRDTCRARMSATR